MPVGCCSRSSSVRDVGRGVRPLGLLIVAILLGGSCQTVGSAGAT